MKTKLTTLILTFVTLLTMTACSPVKILNALVPESGFTLTRDLGYGEGERQKLDIYIPKTITAGQVRPVVVFYYGGAWEAGEKADYLFVAEAITSLGYIAVLPNYRVYPEVTYPGFLDDAAEAVRWTYSNIAQYGGDTRNIFLAGHSAGAHIANMLAFDNRWLNGTAARLRGVIGLSGPYDFLPLKSDRLKAIFPGSEIQMEAQPIRYARRDAPPALLMTGDSDFTVSPGNTKRFSQRIREAGGQVEEKYYPNVGHADMIVAISAPTRANNEVLKDIASFIERERAQ